MKKIYSIFALLLSFPVSYTQTYHPLIETNKIWTYANYMEIMEAPGIEFHTFYAKIGGDTLIGETTYKKVLYSDDKLFTSLYNIIDIIRENTYTKEVFVYDQDSKSERKRYQFGLNASENATIDPSFICNSTDLVVASVENVQINNEDHKQINFQNHDFDSKWIEGIGSLNHLVKTPCMFDAGTILLCVEKQGETIYINPLKNTCFLETSLKQIVPVSPAISIKSNQEFITISLNNETEYINQLEIFSTSGTLLNKLEVNNKEINLSKNSLKKGVYLFKIRSSSNANYSGKFVID